MKIGVITCHNALNHGARLQVYALSAYLESQGHQVTIIDYRPRYMTFNVKLLYWPGSSVKEWAKLFLHILRRRSLIKRHKNFEIYSNKFLKRSLIVYNDLTQLRENPPEADIYIAGSDQIWNVLLPNGSDRAYYLEFGKNDVLRVSYAASFSIPNVEDRFIPFLRQRLRNFDYISVRERSALNILEDLGVSGQKVVDPVFLLSKDEWIKKFIGSTDAEESYILVYDVMNCSRIRRIAEKLSKIRSCPIYSIGSYKLKYADKNFDTLPPDKFVELISNAKTVISNSFHATAFAMIFNKEFFVVNRSDGLNERMVDLLKEHGLLSRLIDDNFEEYNLNMEIDYREFNEKISAEIDQSKLFLRNVTLNIHE